MNNQEEKEEVKEEVKEEEKVDEKKEEKDEKEEGIKICDKCKKAEHKECENRSKCLCDCNKSSKSQIVYKGLASIGGLASIAGGLALTIGTGGLALPIAIPLGGALVGAGFSSTYQGVSKTYAKEDLKATEYFIDVGFGTVAGISSTLYINFTL